MKIGYIGLGALGNELARRFIGGHELTVWDLNPDAMMRMKESGALLPASVADLARDADMIMVCLPRSANVHELLFGSGGIADVIPAGTLFIDQTSGIPQETSAIAALLAARGISMLDAAVSGSPHVVPQGLATLMVSGPDAVYERALPLLQVISSTIYRCGTRVGDGQAMKMINNTMNGGTRMGTLELVALARKAGVPLQPLTTALNEGGGANITTERMLPAIAQGKQATNFALSLMLKDINQAVTLGMEMGVPMPCAAALRSLLQIGLNTLGRDARLEEMIGFIESVAAVRLADAVPLAHETAKPLDSLDALRASGDAAAVATLVTDAVVVLCRHVTYEAVALGVRFGLPLPLMRDILHKGSGWSAASQHLLPALVSGGPITSKTVGQVAHDLRRTAALAIDHGVATTILDAVRAQLDAGVNRLGEGAAADELTRFVEDQSGIRFG